jgi:hypothetical protein
MRSLPQRKRSQEDELTQFIEGSIEQSMKNLRTLEGLVIQFLEWARTYNATYCLVMLLSLRGVDVVGCLRGFDGPAG